MGYETMEDAKAAAKRLQKAVTAKGHRDLKLNMAQAMTARILGYAGWEDLAARFGQVPMPDEEEMEKRLRAEVDEHCFVHDERSYAYAIDALMGAAPDAASGSELLARVGPSMGFRSLGKGVHPLVGDRDGRRGRIHIISDLPGVEAFCMVNAHYSETKTLRVVDLSYEARDAEGLAVALWGTAFVPYEVSLADNEAIYGADEASDDDVRVVTSLVTEHPGFFEDGQGVLHLDGIETRRDLRRRGLARALLGAALFDLTMRWDQMGAVVFSPDRVGDDMPSFRSSGDVRREVEAITLGILTASAAEARYPTVLTIGMLPERGRLQTLMDVSMAIRGGEPGMGTDLEEDEIERRLYGRSIADIRGTDGE